jgi:hypothetical protein
MLSTPLVRHILRDEAVTRGLGDVEARMIVEWLAERAEGIARTAAGEPAAWDAVRDVCRRARSIASFVRLWSMPASRGAANQLAAAERMRWPLPAGDIEAGELMEGILGWEDRLDDLTAGLRARRAA